MTSNGADGASNAAAVAALRGFVEQLDSSQWLSAAAIEARQFAQLGRLAEHAARHAPHFRDRLAAAGVRPADLASRAGLERLPPLTRRDLQTAGGRIDSAVLPTGHAPVVEVRTSGSTGEPVAVRRTRLNQMFWYGMTMRGHAWRGANYSLRSTSIRPNVRGYAVAPNWGPPAGLLHRTGAAQFIPSATEIGDQVKMLVEFRPGILLVYPGVLDAICQHRRAHSIALPDLRHIDTLGETLSPRIREQAMAQFGASVRDLYSSNEVGAIAYQCPSTDTYQLMAESVIVEVADDGGRICAPGEAGRVLVTDLHSFATPLIRYEIGDHAEVGEPCSCGRGLPTLRRILGRERNLMRLPGGGRRWPQVGFARFRDVASVQQYQFIQHRIDDIELRLVVERPLTAREEDDLRSVALRSLGVVAALRLVYFDGRLPTGSSGKFEEFVCLIG